MKFESWENFEEAKQEMINCHRDASVVEDEV
jgi:hypothetical protein